VSRRTHPSRRTRTGRRCLPLVRGAHRAHRCRTGRPAPGGTGAGTGVGTGVGTGTIDTAGADRARQADAERVEGQEGIE